MFVTRRLVCVGGAILVLACDGRAPEELTSPDSAPQATFQVLERTEAGWRGTNIMPATEGPSSVALSWQPVGAPGRTAGAPAAGGRLRTQRFSTRHGVEFAVSVNTPRADDARRETQVVTIAGRVGMVADLVRLPGNRLTGSYTFYDEDGKPSKVIRVSNVNGRVPRADMGRDTLARSRPHVPSDVNSSAPGPSYDLVEEFYQDLDFSTEDNNCSAICWVAAQSVQTAAFYTTEFYTLMEECKEGSWEACVEMDEVAQYMYYWAKKAVVDGARCTACQWRKITEGVFGYETTSGGGWDGDEWVEYCEYTVWYDTETGTVIAVEEVRCWTERVSSAAAE